MQASSNVSHVHPHAKRVSISINVNNVHLVTIKINKITIATKHVNCSESLELNYFTTEQLVVLRKELGRFAFQRDASCLKQVL